MPRIEPVILIRTENRVVVLYTVRFCPVLHANRLPDSLEAWLWTRLAGPLPFSVIYILLFPAPSETKPDRPEIRGEDRPENKKKRNHGSYCKYYYISRTAISAQPPNFSLDLSIYTQLEPPPPKRQIPITHHLGHPDSCQIRFRSRGPAHPVQPP